MLDRRVTGRELLAGDAYTIADIAVWPWYGGLAKGWLYEVVEFLGLREYPPPKLEGRRYEPSLRCPATPPSRH